MKHGKCFITYRIQQERMDLASHRKSVFAFLTSCAEVIPVGGGGGTSISKCRFGTF